MTIITNPKLADLEEWLAADLERGCTLRVVTDSGEVGVFDPSGVTLLPDWHFALTDEDIDRRYLTTGLNVPLLLAVADIIDRTPELFDMNTFAGQNSCGTTHCVGGWAQSIATGYGHNAPDACGEFVLGLDLRHSEELFYPDFGTFWGTVVDSSMGHGSCFDALNERPHEVAAALRSLAADPSMLDSEDWFPSR